MLRSDKEEGCYFPYTARTVCYIFVKNDGTVENLTHNRSNSIKNCEACMKVKAGEAKIYAVWPGKWRSDLFLIEDIDTLQYYFYTGELPDR